MVEISGLNLTAWFYDNVTSKLGFSTATTSADPVHVLNSFLGSSFKGPRAPELARQMIAKKERRWSVPTEDIVGVAAAAERPVNLSGSSSDIEVLRQVIRSLVASDGAVFPSNQAYQVAHPGFVTNDWTGADIGKQCSALLLEWGDGAKAMSSLIERLCTPQPNPLWALQSVFYGRPSASDFTVTAPVKVPWAEEEACISLARHLGSLLHRCVRLGATSVDSLSGLRVLATACEFVCTLIYAQVPSLLGPSRTLVPLLVAVSDEAPTVREVSARVSVPAVHGAMDTWIAGMLQAEVLDRLGEAASDRKAVERFLLRTLPYSRGAKNTRSARSEQMIARAPAMLAHVESGHPYQNLAYPTALVLLDLLRTTMAQSYDSWFDHHARRCGFLAPRRGRSAKRLCVEAPLVTTLVLAGLEDHEPQVEYSTWLERLSSRFGILVGPGDVTRTMVQRASETDLESNQDALALLLARVGLARAYSDNTVEVLNPLPARTETHGS
ncbi:hypothetical protein [Plantactinospora sp. B5E13]|uniref:hypothetical protein n=1 Tax=Plantactinospora sp. B5E13 TaxID=3153758 RepID=UPI00325F25C2